MGACVSSEDTGAPAAYAFNFDAHPTSQETEVWQQCSELLAEASNNIRHLTEYKGCDQVIRTALSTPSEDNESAALKQVEKNVVKVNQFYEFSCALEKMFPTLLTALCLNPESPVSQSNSLVMCLAQTLQYAFVFDELKMVNPAIQNDFSYYRRMLSRMRSGGGAGSKKPVVSEEVANGISFYLAYPTPMMKVLIGAATQMPEPAALVPSLAEIANVACGMASSGTAPQDMQRLLLCLMTGCIVMIDHLSGAGVFHRKSPVRLRACVAVIKGFPPNSEQFLNTLRFSTLHLTDDSTPPAVAKLFE